MHYHHIFWKVSSPCKGHLLIQMVSKLKHPADNCAEQSNNGSPSGVSDNYSTAVLVQDPVIHTSRITLSRQGMVANVDIEPNVIVSELFGKVATQAQYKADDANTYFMSAKPRQFVFFFQFNSLNLCLDARTSNHNSRYIKSTDDPNG